jgi:hypothetical protein
MATKCNSTLGNLTTGSPGSYLVTDGSGSLYWSKQDDKSIEFIEFALEIMGINLKYSDFEKMSNADRIAFVRELRIDSVLKGKEM